MVANADTNDTDIRNNPGYYLEETPRKMFVNLPSCVQTYDLFSEPGHNMRHIIEIY